jgi:hypothetical protein
MADKNADVVSGRGETVCFEGTAGEILPVPPFSKEGT